MKTTEEQLWDYIDGLATGEEQRLIAEQIEQNAQFAEQYKTLLLIHQMMQETELDEPSMSFTRNVMEQVALEPQPVALKTKVDRRIIYSIAAVFIFGILTLLIYTLSQAKLSMQEINLPQMNVSLNASNLVNPMALKVFFCFDVLLALLYVDRLVRTRKPM